MLRIVDRPQSGTVYNMSAVMKGGSWKDAEVKQNGLALGQVVSYGDCANPRQEAVVVESTGGPMGQKAIFLEDGHQTTVSLTDVESPGGWELEPRIMAAAEMDAALKVAAERKADRQAKATLKAEADAKANAAEKARIIAAYPYLERIGQSKKNNRALAASNIKRELARAFPGTTFSVTSESYSGGNHVNVHWTDGPISEEVESIIKKYEDTKFDGMDDSTRYVTSAWIETFGSSGYVFANRRQSDALQQKAADQLCFGPLTFGSPERGGGILNLNDEKAQMVYRLARTMS